MSGESEVDQRAVVEADPPPSDEVVLQLPAEGIYIAVLRTAIAGLAARCDFTIDEIEDLRIAVDEATALLLARTSSTAHLDCRFAIREGGLVAAVSAAVTDTRPPDTGSFGWLVLTALAGSVDATFDGDVMTIELSRPPHQ